MDAIMVDVTDVPGPEVTIDDEFTLIGEQGGASDRRDSKWRSGATPSRMKS